MGKIFVTSDPDEDVHEEMSYDPISRKIGFRYTQKGLKNILDHNREEDANWGKSNPFKYALKHNWVKMASVPNAVLQMWSGEWGIPWSHEDFWPKVTARLNNSEWGKVRTAPGEVGVVREKIVIGWKPKSK